MIPDDIVLKYLVALGTCDRALRAELSSISRDSPISPLVARKGSNPPVRSGVLRDFGSFELHGYGCHVQLDSGEEVEFDWDADGQLVFDNWRLSIFARSLGQSADGEEFTAALDKLVANGLLEELPEGRYRLRPISPLATDG